ncbi:MAG TPA: MG2 domain-containing protein, partial [Candidatus Ozemobacteraceae bacterium]|nr:MG2 domain-containing protein [Candidatus Ozemobacteraceae bacterium]
PDKTARLAIPLTFRTNADKGGSFLVQLCDPEEKTAASAARLLQITDLSITYKLGTTNALFWVTSLEKGSPVAGAAVLAIDRHDHRFLLGRTNAEGLLFVPASSTYPAVTTTGEGPRLAPQTFDPQAVVLVVAATPTDSSFVQVMANRFKPFGVETAAPGQAESRTRTGHIFTERGVYRPGETVHFKLAMRRFVDFAVRAPEDEKVEVTITNPKDDIIYSEDLVLNSFGTASDSLPLKDFAPLGEYTVKVTYKALDQEKAEPVTVANTTFQVQKFEPPRHYVTIATERKTRPDNSVVTRPTQEEYLEAKIESKYYTGGFVKNAKVRWTANLVPVTPNIPGFETYRFGNHTTGNTLVESGEALLDQDGALSVALPLDRSLINGLFGLEISATVLDVDGRPATKVDTYQPKAPFRVGMTKLPGTILPGDVISVGAIAVDPQNRRITSGAIRFEVFKKRYYYVQKRDEDGNLFYRWESGWTRMTSSEQQIRDGEALFEVGFDDYWSELQLQMVYTTPEGEFMCRVPVEIGYVSDSDEDEDETNRRRKSDHQVLLLLSQSEAAAGEKVMVSFNLPRPATHALVTCEQQNLLDYKVIAVKGRYGTFDVVMKPESRPNVFVTMTAAAGRNGLPVYRSQVDAFPPSVYYGVDRVRVKNVISSLKVEIQPTEANLKGRPGEPRELEFIVTDAAGKPAVCEMAVCVVDEAVLSLTGFVTPLLHRLAEFTTPLTVFTGDLRLSLITQELYKLFRTNPLTGGDSGGGGLASDLAMRRDFRPVAYWNPALQPDAQGKARIRFTLPDSTTAYRVYVVALDRGDAFASVDRQMVVTKEFYVQPGMPRFLTVGDKAVFPLSACNKTEDALEADLKVEGRNVLVKLSQPKASMKPMTNTPVPVEVEADTHAPEALLTFRGTAGAFNDGIELPLPLQPRRLAINRARIGHFTDKAEIDAEIPAAVSLIPENERRGVLTAIVALSTTEWTKVAPGLRYLLQYPYGCIEQTSSGIIPLAALRRMAAQNLIPGVTKETVDKFLKAGVLRVLRMQRSSGGFAYWPEQSEVTWWGTLYATFALTAAQQAKLEDPDAAFEVPESALEKALSYIAQRVLKEKDSSDWHYYGVYELAAVNLALNNKLTAADLDRLLAEFDKRSEEGKAFLIWAAAASKHLTPARMKDLLKKLNPKLGPSSTTWYDSGTRELAAALAAQMQADPSSRKADDYAGSLLKSVNREGYWGSTAHTGWCLYALSQYLTKKMLGKGEEVPVEVRQPGRDPVKVRVGQNSSEVELDAEALLKNGKVQLTTAGKKLVNWTLMVTYPDTATSAEDLNQGFLVEKKITNLNGSNEFRVGDIVKVSIEFADTPSQSQNWRNYRNYEYLALEDPLPAGFMAINTALKNDRRPVTTNEDGEESSSDDSESEEDWAPWEDGAYLFRPDHSEMHPEKVVAFRDRLWSNRFRFTYFARAICEGEFMLRPTRVSLMYDPETYGLSQSQTVKVLPAK